nr:hypothetical protein [Tanacetum cinerariifolium]
MNNKKRIINLKYFREMLHICPRIPNQPFNEIPFEEEILAFLRKLGHSGEIKKITDFGTILPVELTNEAIRNSTAYKEYYATALGEEPPKTKASLRKTQSSSDTTMAPPVAKGTRFQTLAKGKQPAKSSTSKDNDGDDFVHPKFFTHDEEAKDEESFVPILQTPSHVENSNDKGNDDASHGMNVEGDEGPDTEDGDNEFPNTCIDSRFEPTPQVDVPVMTIVEPLPLTASTLPPPFIPIISKYLDHRMNEVVKVAVQLQFDRLRDEGKAKNEDFLNKLDENIQKIIKEQVKGQVKVQVSKILPKIKKTVNEKLEAKVLTHAVTLKRRRDDEDKDEERSIGLDRGSKKDEQEKSQNQPVIQRKRLPRPMENWITMRRDDDKLYKFKDGDFKRLRIQDIKDMLLLLVQGKLTNLTVEERFAFNVSLRMFTRSIVIQQHMKDLQLGVERYQKKLNLTNIDMYRFDLKHKEAYIVYSNPRGFVYQNKDKLNRLICIDKLKKISDDTLNDVQTALDDRLKGIQIKHLPQTIWRRSDKERAVAMIQAIDK